MRALNRLLLFVGALASLAVVSAQLSVKLVEPTSFDLTTRFLETIYHEKPDAFYPFLRQLQQFQLRPKVTFADAAFKSSKTLEGKPRPSRYADHNPIFTLLAQPFEAWQALEASFFRSRLWTARGASVVWRMALANDVAVPTLEAMNKVWKERELELAGSKACQSFIDVAGSKACTTDDFWKLVGPEQIFARTPVDVEGVAPKTFPFDRFLPRARNESLPLAILYAAPTDEGFPALFDLLHKLAQPAAGRPRLQFALRWKVNTESPTTTFAHRFQVKARPQAEKDEAPEDLASRAIAYVDAATDKMAALSRLASSLPLIRPELAAFDISGAARPDIAANVKNAVHLNGIQVSNEEGVDVETLLSVMRNDNKLLNDLARIPQAEERLAKAIVLNASITLETLKDGAKGLVLPTTKRPLEFVHLVEAVKDVPPLVTRASYIEGVSEEDRDVDPPALATIYLVADLESAQGRSQVKHALKFLDSTSEVRLAFLHLPASGASKAPDADQPYAFSSLLYSLIPSKQLAEVYPSELLAFLDLEIGPTGPKRSLNDMWTEDNPITPFLDGGLKQEELEGAKSYFDGVRKFASKLGIVPGEPAVVINGRIIRLEGEIMSSATLSNLVQYELKRRIRPVVAAALPALSPKIEQDRVLQAELYNLATSVLASSGIKGRSTARVDLAPLEPSISVSNSSVVAMYHVSATIDPTSRFGRSVVPMLSALSRTPLFTVDIHLVPTSAPESEDQASSLAASYGASFSDTIEFDEDETLQEMEATVELAGFEVGSTLDVVVEVDGEAVAQPRRIVIDGTKQSVVFEKSPRKKDSENQVSHHPRDEL